MQKDYLKTTFGLCLLLATFWILLMLAGGCSSRVVKRTPSAEPALSPTPAIAEATPLAQAEEGFLPSIGGYEFTPVYFDFDQSAVRSDQTVTLALHASQIGDKDYVLTGHCDERGTTDYNLALGMRRAQAVKVFLQRLGCKGNLTCVSLGEEKPADLGHDETAWAKNRRVEFSE